MKKFIVSVAVIIFLFSISNVLPVYSTENEYRRIITHDTPFYKDSAGIDFMFNLPYTYYVKILDHGEVLSHVEIYGTSNIPVLDGYVPTNALYNDGLSVSEPYANLTLTTHSTTVLYKTTEFDTTLCYVFAERDLFYLGNAQDENGKRYYFVRYNNRLGYVFEDAVYPFTIPNHPNQLTFLTPELEESVSTDTPETTDGLFSLKIAVVICLVFAGLTALIVVIRKKEKPSVAVSYYDENDYE